jgi:hypothetical protein
LFGSAYSFFFGGTTSGKIVNERKVIAVLSKDDKQNYRGLNGYLVETKIIALIAMKVYNMATIKPVDK